MTNTDETPVVAPIFAQQTRWEVGATLRGTSDTFKRGRIFTVDELIEAGYTVRYERSLLTAATPYFKHAFLAKRVASA